MCSPRRHHLNAYSILDPRWLATRRRAYVHFQDCAVAPHYCPKINSLAVKQTQNLNLAATQDMTWERHLTVTSLSDRRFATPKRLRQGTLVETLLPQDLGI